MSYRSVDAAVSHFPQHNQNGAKAHIREIIEKIPSLRLVSNSTTTTDVFVEGTIPVSIGSSSYNIPVRLWVPTSYPQAPPSMRVIPTDTMYVAASRHVDKYGTVYHPYLHSWNANNSTLYEFICVVSGVFAREPPVYSKPPATQSSATSSTPAADSYPQRTNNHSEPTNRNTMNSDKDDEEKMMETIKRQSLQEILTTKIKRRIMEMSEMEKLKRDHRTLSEGKLLLDDVFLNLRRDEGRLRQGMGVITEKSKELRKVIEPLMKDDDGRDIDDEVKATAPLYTQLLQTVAEENAIQDTIYQLSRALHDGQSSLDEYLKLTRNLSRDQFLKRALILKARKEAGLR